MRIIGSRELRDAPENQDLSKRGDSAIFREALHWRCAMLDRARILLAVEEEARRALGGRASEWMMRPNRLLDGMAPADLATSTEGARVVLHELRKASTLLGANTLLKVA